MKKFKDVKYDTKGQGCFTNGVLRMLFGKQCMAFRPSALTTTTTIYTTTVFTTTAAPTTRHTTTPITCTPTAPPSTTSTTTTPSTTDAVFNCLVEFPHLGKIGYHSIDTSNSQNPYENDIISYHVGTDLYFAEVIARGLSEEPTVLIFRGIEFLNTSAFVDDTRGTAAKVLPNINCFQNASTNSNGLTPDITVTEPTNWSVDSEGKYKNDALCLYTLTNIVLSNNKIEFDLAGNLFTTYYHKIVKVVDSVETIIQQYDANVNTGQTKQTINFGSSITEGFYKLKITVIGCDEKEYIKELIENQKVYVSANTKAYPEYGVGAVEYLGSNGTIRRTFINLELFEDSGVLKMRDLSWNQDFENYIDPSVAYNNKTKIYTYGYYNYSDPTTYFTKAQMQLGVDISGFIGRDITITAIAIADTGEFIDFKQQSLHVGSNDVSITVSSIANGGTTYYRYPTGTVIDMGMHHNVRDNVAQALPAALNIANQMNYVEDVVNPLLPSKNIYSKVPDATLGKLIVEISDDFYDGIKGGNPSTNTVFESNYVQRLQLVKQQSDQSISYNDTTNKYVSIGITDNDQAAWLFFNNEKGGHELFAEMVRRTIVSFPSIKIEAWLENDFESYSNFSSLSDADLKTNLYSALSLPTSTTWAAFKANTTANTVFTFKTGLSTALNVQSANCYENDNRWFKLYYRVNELIALKKFNYFDANRDVNGNKKIWSMSQWYIQETLTGSTFIQNSRLYKFHEGINQSRMWFEKPCIDNAAMYNLALMNIIILGDDGGTNVWAGANNTIYGKFGDKDTYNTAQNGLEEPFNRTFGQYSEILGVYEKYYIVDSEGNTSYQTPGFSFPSYYVEAVGTAALNSWLNAIKIATLLYNIFADSEIGFAEFQSGGVWKTGEDTTTEAGIQNKTPVVLYLKNTSNEILFLPFMHGNTVDLVVQVRLPGIAQEYSVVVEGSYVVPQTV